MMERHNRKSHLAFPQMSPASKALLRGEDVNGKTITQPREKRRERPADSSSTPTPSSSTSSLTPTPTSGDIVITRDPTARLSAGTRPAFPLRTSSAGQVPQQISSAQAINLPVRPAPQLVATAPRASSRRPDTAGSAGSISASADRSAEQAAYSRRPIQRSGQSDARLANGFSAVAGSREGFVGTPPPVPSPYPASSANGGTEERVRYDSQASNSRNHYERF